VFIHFRKQCDWDSVYGGERLFVDRDLFEWISGYRRLARFVATLLIAFLVLIIAALHLATDVTAQSCNPGYGTCSGGGCAPLGSQCCSEGGYCSGGDVCSGNGKCAPANSVICSDGSYCEQGQICTKENKCLSTSSTRYCGGNNYCDQGFICTKNNRCLSIESPSYCGGKSYCENGALCTNEKECIPQGSDRICGGEHYCPQGTVCNASGGCSGRNSTIIVPPVFDSAPAFPQREDGRKPAAKPGKGKSDPPKVELTVHGMTIATGTGAGSLSCSSISGLPDSGAPDPSCTDNSHWTITEPFNHAKAPVEFHPFYGNSISIPMGSSLWSVPDGDSPTGRKLEARPWNKKPHTSSVCAVEHLNAVSQGEFQVSIECESRRQKQLADEFARNFPHREDSVPFKDYDNCREPWQVFETPGWQKQTLAYWKQHPSFPTAQCVKGNESYPLRQKHWHTKSMCEILSSVGSVGPIVINKRGIQGCEDKGQ
jgi:hypothetical protein